MKTYTLQEVIKIVGIDKYQVTYRKECLGIKNKKNAYTQTELDDIVNFKKEKIKVIYYKSTETFEIYPSKMNYLNIEV